LIRLHLLIAYLPQQLDRLLVITLTNDTNRFKSYFSPIQAFIIGIATISIRDCGVMNGPTIHKLGVHQLGRLEVIAQFKLIQLFLAGVENKQVLLPLHVRTATTHCIIGIFVPKFPLLTFDGNPLPPGTALGMPSRRRPEGSLPDFFCSSAHNKTQSMERINRHVSPRKHWR